MQLVKNGDTTTPITFLMVQASDHISGLTGATPTVTISKNGAAFGAAAGVVAEIGNGWYKLTPAAGDVGTNGPGMLHATAAGGDPSDIPFQVLADLPGGTVSSVTGNVAGNVTGSVGSLATQAKTDAENAVWNAVRASHTTTGTFGGDAISAPTNFGVMSIDASGHVALQSTEHTAIAADVLNATAASYNTANTIGAKINAAGANADPWSITLPGSYAAGTAGAIVGGNLDAKMSSRVASTVIGTPAGASVSADIASITSKIGTPAGASVSADVAAVKTDLDGGVKVSTYATGQDPATLVLDGLASNHNGANTVGSKINAAASAGDPWSTTLPGAYASGTAGYIVGQNIDAKVSSRNAGNVIVGGYAIGQDPATLVLDVASSGHNGTGSIGQKINSAGTASDPLTAAVPGPYAPGTAGYVLGTNLDAKISLTATTSGISSGVTLTSAERNAVADAVLDRDDPVETGFSLRRSLRVLRSFAFGNSQGGGQHMRDATNMKDRLVVSIDASGNRTFTTVDPS